MIELSKSLSSLTYSRSCWAYRELYKSICGGRVEQHESP
jgi:hypothetical protein